MLSKGQIVGIDWNRIAQLLSILRRLVGCIMRCVNVTERCC